MAKRRVFISYHHANEQAIVDQFSRRFSQDYEVFTDSSVDRAADSDDVEYLNQVCRDAIKGTSVTIVLVGRETGKRKFVDWEIRYTLECQHGLFGLLRPDLDEGYASIPARLRDNTESGFAVYYYYPSSPADLRKCIDVAFNADIRKVDNSRPKMTRNS